MSTAEERFDCTAVDEGESLPFGDIPVPVRSFRCDGQDITVTVFEYESADDADEALSAGQLFGGCIEYILNGAIYVEAYDTEDFETSLLESSGLAEALGNEVQRSGSCG